VRDWKLVVSRCALDKHFASISGRWPVPHVRDQEMLDDDSGFGEIAVEICTRTLPQFRLASCENGAMQTAALRAGDVPQGEYAITQGTRAYGVSCQCPVMRENTLGAADSPEMMLNSPA
jgi:hypothetical protein